MGRTKSFIINVERGKRVPSLLFSAWLNVNSWITLFDSQEPSYAVCHPLAGLKRKLPFLGTLAYWWTFSVPATSSLRYALVQNVPDSWVFPWKRQVIVFGDTGSYLDIYIWKVIRRTREFISGLVKSEVTLCELLVDPSDHCQSLRFWDYSMTMSLLQRSISADY